MRNTTLTLLTSLLLAACSSEPADTTDEQSACQEAAQCVSETCIQLEPVAECIEGTSDLSDEACANNEMFLYECGRDECSAGSDAVGEALALMTDAYAGMRCEG